MVRRTGPTNYQLNSLLDDIRPRVKDSRFWRRVAEDLSKPTRQRRVVNIYTIDACAQDGETILVPGKVLSLGELRKKVDVAAMNFSEDAKKKIIAAKGKALTIRELLQQNPDGKNVRIVG